MLEDGEGGLVEVLDEADGSLDVLEVVVGEFLAVQLGEVSREVSVEDSTLVWVLPIAQGLCGVSAETQGGGIGPVEPAEDGSVVAGAHGEGTTC